MDDMDKQRAKRSMNNVGAFLSAFALLESTSYQIYDLFPDDELTKFGRTTSQFQRRVRHAQALMRNSELIRSERMEELFDEALVLSAFRNKVAHNPQVTDVYQNAETGELKLEGPFFRDAKTYGKHSKNLPIKIEDVGANTERAMRIWMDLQKLIMESLEMKS